MPKEAFTKVCPRCCLILHPFFDPHKSDQNLFRLYLQWPLTTTAINVRSTFSVATKENVEESIRCAVCSSDEECEGCTDDYGGADVLIATDGGVSDKIIELSKNWPAIKFVAFDADSSIKVTNNSAIVRPRWFRALYLAGVVCGMSATTSKVGLIIQMPLTTQLVQYANAFYLGVMNSSRIEGRNLTVGMATVDAWNTSVAAEAAAESLLSWGAGCLTAAQGNSAANSVFSEKNIPSVGFASNARIFSGDKVLTSFLIDPAPTFTQLMQMALMDDWTGEDYIYTGASDVERGDWSMHVDIPKRKLIDSYVAINNDGTAGNIFCNGANDTLGIRWDVMNTTCPTFVDLFSNATMKLSPYLVRVADWTTYRATKRVYWRWSDSLSITYYAIGGIILLFCFYLIPHIIYYRRSRVYATASWWVLLMVPIAIIITMFSGATYLGSPTNVQCHLRLWIESIGVVILLGALQARNFTHFMWKKRGLTQLTKEYEDRFTVSPHSLFVQWLFPLLIADLCILTFFSSVTPIYTVVETAAFLDSGSVQVICKSEKNYLYIILNVYHAIIAVTNLVFFYVLKNIPLLGTDVVATGATVLNLVFFAGLNIFVSVIVGRALISVALTIGLKLIVSIVALAVLIIPKWWAITFRGVKEELDLIENSRNTESSMISTTSMASGVVSFNSAPGGALRPKEQMPEFYSDSSESPSISISSEFFEDESDDSDVEDAESTTSSSSGSDGFGSGMKRLERFKRRQVQPNASGNTPNDTQTAFKTDESSNESAEVVASKRSASTDSSSKPSEVHSLLRQSSGSRQSDQAVDESDASSSDYSSSVPAAPERSTSPVRQDSHAEATDSEELSSYDEDHENFRKDDRV